MWFLRIKRGTSLLDDGFFRSLWYEVVNGNVRSSSGFVTLNNNTNVKGDKNVNNTFKFTLQTNKNNNSQLRLTAMPRTMYHHMAVEGYISVASIVKKVLSDGDGNCF